MAVEEPQQERPVVRRLLLGHVAWRVDEQGQRREAGHQPRVGARQQAREVLLAEPVGELVGTEAVGSVHPHEDEPLVGVVERQLDRHAVDVTAGLQANRYKSVWTWSRSSNMRPAACKALTWRTAQRFHRSW